MKTTIKAAVVTFSHRNFIRPLQLSSGPIVGITEAHVRVTVSVNGNEATGQGAIFLSDLWAWPDPARSHAERDTEMRRFCERIAADLPTLCGGEATHPLTLGMRLHGSLPYSEAPEAMPMLARLVCASPFDAALHDAVGIALRRSAFGLYAETFVSPEADDWFPARNAGEAIRRTLREPVSALAAWLVVGHDDTRADIAPWVERRRYRCFKLKLLGKENAADVRRTSEVFRWARSLGAKTPQLAIDTNCANPDAASVLDYLERLRHTDAEAFAALEYVEQPTSRDILQSPYNWRAVARLKPVILDEGLVGMKQLQAAREQGWSGIALKTCRGHSFLLTAAAYAREHGMLLAMQDLTNPGIAAIHSALFAAHLPVFNGVELNSPQYTPDANTDWLPRLSALLEPTDGCHRLPQTIPYGLGSTL